VITPNVTPAAGSLAGTVDVHAPADLHGGTVYAGFDATLLQTNLGANANKFIRLQLVRARPGAGLTFHRRWGRVGERGMQKQEGPFVEARAESTFESYFRSKTGFSWEERDNPPPPQAGKYGLVEMETDADAAQRQLNTTPGASPMPKAAVPPTLPSTLAPTTRALMDLIFEKETFESAMHALELDPARLPLGALSKAQVDRGERALEDLEAAIARRAPKSELQRLTGIFYTVIPHAFGRKVPPALDTKAAVDAKFDMLNTLRDIDEANQMAARVDEAAAKAAATAPAGAMPARPHPADERFAQLDCDLVPLGDGDADMQLIRTYLAKTKSSGQRCSLRHVWRVDRHGEGARFAQHAGLDNRRLLWHGTNVAVVAAILKSGLRIMPHSGGRVGRGIYLADAQEKSASYVRSVPSKDGSGGEAAIMFLVEAALGRQHEVTADGPPSTFTAAPPGSDSVLARGRRQPDPAQDAKLQIDGKPVAVPQGAFVKTGVSSSFEHNEFLVYQESQHRIRYVLQFDW